MGTTPSDTAPAATQSETELAADDVGLPDQRAHLRFDKMFVVRLESLLFGEIYCVARNVSAGGIFLEIPIRCRSARPCGSVPRPRRLRRRGRDRRGEEPLLHQLHPGWLNRAVAGMAVRFTSFENESHHVLADCLSRMRVLH